jgi:hypothetical protein
LQGLLSSAKPDARASAQALQIVAGKESGLPLEFGPPPIYKPTQEILGELYLQTHQLAAAKKAFELELARAPGRRLDVRGLAQAEK